MNRIPTPFFSPAVLLLALFLGASSPLSAQGDLEAAFGRLDPAGSRWDTEAWSKEAVAQLKTLFAGVGEHDREALAGVLPPEAELLFPSPSAWTQRPHHEVVTRYFEANGASEAPVSRRGEGAIAALNSWLEGVEHPHAHFKVIEVHPDGAERVRVTLRVEVEGMRAGRAWQSVVRWRTLWKRSGTGLRLERLEMIRGEEISAPRRGFTEVSASLFKAGVPGVDALGRGGEWWPGHLDTVGDFSLMGHQGIAIGDVNGDGRDDLYVAMPGGLPNRLYLRREDGSLVEAAAVAQAAWLDDTKGVLFADMDGDGDQDLLLAMGPNIVLAKNDGSGRFERLVAMRARGGASFYSLAVADYDLDGDLDIYGCRYVKEAYAVSLPLPFHDATNGPTNHLIRNEGKDRFRDVTVASGLSVNNSRFSLSAAWGDYDDDGDPDLYVANDFGRNNLYRNDKGRFVDVAAEAGVEDQAAGMGATWGDVDGDGDLDLYVTNMFSSAGRRIAYQPRFKAGLPEEERRQLQGLSLGNSLFENLGGGRFRQTADRRGVRVGRWGWGASFADLDNDGRLDIVAPNGFLSGRAKDDL